MGLVWTGIAIAVVAAVVAVQMTRPGRRRRAAVKQALAEAEAAARANERDLGAQVKLAQVQLDLAEMPREARAILERVIAAEPRHWADGAPPTRFLLTHAHVKCGDLQNGIEHYQAF